MIYIYTLVVLLSFLLSSCKPEAITFYRDDNYGVRLYGSDRVPTSCQTLPWWMWGKVSSLKTNKCVRLYDSENCKGSYYDRAHGSHGNLGGFDNKMVSYHSCFKYDTVKELRIKLFAERNYEHLLYDEQIHAGCNKVHDTTQFLTSSIQTPICVILSSNTDCDGYTSHLPAGNYPKLPDFFENYVHSFRPCNPKDMETAFPLKMVLGQLRFRSDATALPPKPITTTTTTKPPTTAKPRTFKISAKIVKFEIDSEEWKVKLRTKTEFGEMGHKSIFRNDGPAIQTQRYTTTKSLSDRVEVERASSLSRMDELTMSDSVSKDFSSGFRKALNTGFRKTSSSGHNKGRTEGRENGGSSSVNVGVGGSRGSSRTTGESESYGGSQTSDLSQSSGFSQSSGRSNSHGSSSTSGFSETNGISESSSYGSTISSSESFGSSSSFGVSTDVGVSVSANAGVNVGFASAGVSVGASANFGTNANHGSTHDRSRSSSSTNTNESSSRKDTTNSRSNSVTSDQTSSSSTGVTSDITRRNSVTNSRDSSRSNSATNTEDQSYNIGRTDAKHSSTTSGSSSQFHQEFSSETNAFENEERNVESKIGRALTSSYRDMITSEASSSSRYSQEESKSFSIDQTIQVPACTQYEVTSFVKSTKDFPVQYATYVELTGSYDDDGSGMPASELRKNLRGMEYVAEENDKTILVKGNGSIVLDYSWYSVWNGKGEPIVSCEDGVNDSRFPDISFYDETNFKGLLLKTKLTGGCQLLPYSIRNRVEALRSPECVILFPTETCDAVDESNELVGYTLEVQPGRGSSLPFFGNVAQAFQYCQSYYDARNRSEAQVQFYGDPKESGVEPLLDAPLTRSCRNSPRTSRGKVSALDSNHCITLFSGRDCQGANFTFRPNSAMNLKHHFDKKTVSYRACFPSLTPEYLAEANPSNFGGAFFSKNIYLYEDKNFTDLLFDAPLTKKCKTLRKEAWRKTSSLVTDSCVVLYSLPYCQGNSITVRKGSEELIQRSFDKYLMSFTACEGEEEEDVPAYIPEVELPEVYAADASYQEQSYDRPFPTESTFLIGYAYASRKEFYGSRLNLNWYGADAHCRNLNMTLASISSEEEAALLDNSFDSSAFFGYFWTSGRCKSRNCQYLEQFSWEDKSKPNGSFLALTEVDEEDLSRTCLSYESRIGAASHLASEPCSGVNHVLCESKSILPDFQQTFSLEETDTT